MFGSTPPAPPAAPKPALPAPAMAAPAAPAAAPGLPQPAQPMKPQVPQFAPGSMVTAVPTGEKAKLIGEQPVMVVAQMQEWLVVRLATGALETLKVLEVQPATMAPMATPPGQGPQVPAKPAVAAPAPKPAPVNASDYFEDRDLFLLSASSWIGKFDLASANADGSRSWIQVAKTGKFFSPKYGKFEITSTDLRQMLANFRDVTPKAPTQLPVDYDHLSMQPKTPGDGKAAGWFAGPMELRSDGNELWAEIEWTDPAASSIRNKEYRYISPSFVKKHRHSDGREIGTTLLAAAITNHPFLEGMAALSLSRVDDWPRGAEETPMFDLSKASPEAKRSAVSAAIKAKGLCDAPDVVELTDDQVVYACQGKRLRQSLSFDESTVAFSGKPVLMLSQGGRTDMDKVIVKTAEGVEVELDRASVEVLPFVQELKNQTADGSSVVVNASMFEAMGKNIESLQEQVVSLSKEATDAKRVAFEQSLTIELDKLKGRITKPERDWARKTFGSHLDLSSFREWAATKTAKVVELEREHGDGVVSEASPKGEGAGMELIELSKTLAKDAGISLSQAMVRVSADRPELAEAYRAGFMPDAD